jgi:hypothetical protein
MNQSSSLTRQLTDAQERHAAQVQPPVRTYSPGQFPPEAPALVPCLGASTHYRLYTVQHRALLAIVSRYTLAATITGAMGLWHGHVEDAATIDIVHTAAALPMMRALAHALCQELGESAVLLTWHDTAFHFEWATQAI